MSSHRNIVLIIADDLGKYVGAYGCLSVQTPAIDALATDGIRFDSAFASTASCSGSRSTIYTGLHTHENGQYGLNLYRAHFQTFDHVDSAPKLFNQAGWRTGILGKVHVGPSEVYPWQVELETDTRDVAYIADRAEDFFTECVVEDVPFFLTIGYVDPHRDVATRGGFGNDCDFDPRIRKKVFDPDEVEVPSWLNDDTATRLELSEYYQAIHRMDQGVGLVVAALKRRGLYDNTLIIVTSDNGPPFINAKTTLYDAGTCLPLIVRAPRRKTNIANPNMISWVDILPSLLDYAGIPQKCHTGAWVQPSLGKMATSKTVPSPPMSGISFWPIVDCSELLADDKWRHHVFGSHTFHELQNYWPTRVLRTRGYKYHRNIAWKLDFPFASDLYASYSFEAVRRGGQPPMIGQRSLPRYLSRPAEELFDLEADPDEINNLASLPQYSHILQGLRHTMERWQHDTHDLWLFKDGHSVLKMQRYAQDGLCAPDRHDMGLDIPADAPSVVVLGVQDTTERMCTLGS